MGNRKALQVYPHTLWTVWWPPAKAYPDPAAYHKWYKVRTRNMPVWRDLARPGSITLPVPLYLCGSSARSDS